MPKRKRLADRHVVHEGADLVSDAKELITRMRQLLLADEGDDSPMRFRRSEIAVLDTLGAEGPIVMGQLARRLRLPLSTATRIVNRLVEGKMVRRERLENNRRVVQVRLAQVGLRYYRAALDSRMAGAQQMLRRLDGCERRELVRLIRKIADRAFARAE